jgi:hypothetical protein
MVSHDVPEMIGKAGFPSGHALVIAVAAYPKISPLPAAVIDDAREMNAVLTSQMYCGYHSSNVTLLLDDQATLGAIRRELNALAGRAHPDDTVVIFFSGHGARLGNSSNPESALIPFDCDPADINKTVLLEAEFSAALASIKAKRLIVLLDACHSGAAGSFKEAGYLPDFGFNEKSLDRLAQGSGRIVIASSRASEFSLVLAGANHSLFTEHFLGALRGGARTHGDGLIRVFEVFNYVSEKVRAAAPGRQHPIFKATDLEDNFPIALDRGGTKATAVATVGAGQGMVWRQMEEIFADLYPAGPLDQEIWMRAGGDVSRLRLTGAGRANWFSALRTLRQGGGGTQISQIALIRTALEDFPHHQELIRLTAL